MHTELKVSRRGNEIRLISERSGRRFLWLLVAEIVVLGAYFANLAASVGVSSELVVPAVPSVALLVWTGSMIRSNAQVVMDLSTGEGRLEKVGPLAGPREIARFAHGEVEAIALRQVRDWQAGARHSAYVVAIDLRGGNRHVLSGTGPLLAYNRVLAEFGRLTGIGSRIERLPAG
jgi:hypothetical protein